MNSTEMPQQSQLAQSAGLGAMLQAKGSATGVGKQSMDKMMALADKLPDSELADVLSGKSVRVPQFAAMLAAMGRESLRTAVAGAQAGQDKKPSKKDQMLARMQPQAQQPMLPQAPAGLAAVPAPNMETVSAAEGGIIGYSGDVGSRVEDPDSDKRRLTTDQLFKGLKDFFITDPSKSRWKQAIEDAAVSDTTSAEAAARTSLADTPGAADGYNYPAFNKPRNFGSGAYGASSSSASANPASSSFPPGMIDASTLPGRASIMTPTEPSAAASSLGPSAPKGTGPQGSGIAPPAAGRFEAPPARKSPIDQLMAPTEDIAKQVASGKNQAQGEFLMQMGASLMGNPNLGRALQQGIERGLPGLAANRKEANALIKDQRDYSLNMSKAQEAAAQGRDDLAFKYADLAEKAQYHAGVIGVGMARASGAGGNLTAKQYESARKAADTALENELKRLGPRSRLMTPEQRDAFRTEAFNRTLQTIQSGVMPEAPGIPTYGAPPQGAVTRE
jgi:hypothetical protein